MSARRFNKPGVGEHREKVAQIARQISFELANADFALAHGDKDRVFSRMLENADKWVDPTLTVEENRKIAKRRYGLKTKGEAEKEVKDAKHKARDSARNAIYENIQAIEAGEAAELLSDIEAEYGEAWVTETIADARGWAIGEGLIDPEPEPEPTPDPAPMPTEATESRGVISRVLRPVKLVLLVLYLVFQLPTEPSEEVAANV